MLVDKDKILELIPHGPPMLMVDGLIASDGYTTTSRLILDESNLFCQDGYFHEPGLAENIAQTVALRGGYQALQDGEPVKKGFIGSIKRFSVFQLPKDNDTLITTIAVTNQLQNAFVISGKVYVGNILMAEGEMIIFEER